MRAEHDPYPAEPAARDAVPNTLPARGYLRGVLSDGAKPFLYRNRVRRLLGLPDADGVALTFAPVLLMPGFTYARSQTAGFAEQPDDLLTSIVEALNPATGFAASQPHARRVDPQPAEGFPPPAARHAENSTPGHVAPIEETPPSAARGEAEPTPPAPFDRTGPAPKDAPATDPPTAAGPAPSFTALTIPGGHAGRPSPITRSPGLPSQPAPRAGLPSAPAPDPGAAEMRATSISATNAPPPAARRLHKVQPAGRWQPTHASVAPADNPAPSDQPLSRGGNGANAPLPGLTAAGRVRPVTDAPAPTAPVPTAAAMGPSYPLTLPYVDAGRPGATGGKGRQVPHDEEARADDWPAVQRPAQPPAPQVIVVRAPESYVRQPPAAFWERSHRRRLQTRLLR